MWLGGITAGAIADAMRTGEDLVNETISGTTVTSADGNDVDLGGSAVTGGQQFGSATDNEIMARIDETAMKFGLRVANVSLLHPWETAADITLIVPDDLTPTWTLDELRATITGTPTDLEGVYLRLESSDGAALLESGAAYRIGGGGLWFADGQDDRFGAVHGGRAVISDNGDAAQ
jgi:hypothetical protein